MDFTFSPSWGDPSLNFLFTLDSRLPSFISLISCADSDSCSRAHSRSNTCSVAPPSSIAFSSSFLMFLTPCAPRSSMLARCSLCQHQLK
jgi:hypothetical protein